MKKDKTNYEKNKKDFIQMLMSVDKDQLQEFIKTKGREPKMIKPFICLNTRINH